jgi:hypothetical protein
MAAAQLLRSHDTGNTDDWNGSAAVSRPRELSDRLERGAASQANKRQESTANGRISLQVAVQIFQVSGSPRRTSA